VQDRITYVEEMPERFQTPTTTIAMGYGDCDDFTTLIASLLESIGIESELVGMQWSVPGEGKFYRHIFPRAVVTQGGRVYEIPLDATERQDIYELMNPVEVALALGRKDLRLYVA
jgi:transglutaminase-like putative cysteine protease